MARSSGIDHSCSCALGEYVQGRGIRISELGERLTADTARTTPQCAVEIGSGLVDAAVHPLGGGKDGVGDEGEAGPPQSWNEFALKVGSRKPICREVYDQFRYLPGFGVLRSNDGGRAMGPEAQSRSCYRHVREPGIFR